MYGFQGVLLNQGVTEGCKGRFFGCVCSSVPLSGIEARSRSCPASMIPKGSFCGKKMEEFCSERLLRSFKQIFLQCFQLLALGWFCTVTQWVTWKMADYCHDLRQIKNHNAFKMCFKYLRAFVSWDPQSFLKSHWSQPSRDHPSAGGHCGYF